MDILHAADNNYTGLSCCEHYWSDFRFVNVNNIKTTLWNATFIR